MDYDEFKQHKKTRRLINEAVQTLGVLMTEGFSRLDAALTGISGDVDRLAAAAQALQEAVDAAVADKEEAVSQAVAAAKAEFDAALEPLVAKAEAIDARNPEPTTEEPAPEPTPEPEPEQPSGPNLPPEIIV